VIGCLDSKTSVRPGCPGHLRKGGIGKFRALGQAVHFKGFSFSRLIEESWPRQVLGGGKSTKRLKSGAEKCWEERRLRRAEILAPPRSSPQRMLCPKTRASANSPLILLAPGFWLLAPGSWLLSFAPCTPRTPRSLCAHGPLPKAFRTVQGSAVT
jgi:hypothetical protein